MPSSECFTWNVAIKRTSLVDRLYMFHVEHSRSDRALFEDHQPAAERFDERKRRRPGERRGSAPAGRRQWLRGTGRAGRRVSTNACKLISTRARRGPPGSSARSCASCRSGRASSSSNREVATVRVRQSERADRLAQEHRLPRLRLDHQQARAPGTASANGIAGDPPPLPMSIIRAAPAANAAPPPAARSSSRSSAPVSARRVQTGQVDLRVPGGEQPVVGLELLPSRRDRS